MHQILAVDVSGSTTWYEPYYKHVETIVEKFPRAELYAWDTSFRKHPSKTFYSSGGGTQIYAVLDLLRSVTEHDKIELIVVTDAQLSAGDVDDCLREYNRQNILKKVQILYMYFIGEEQSINALAEKCLFEPHMKLMLSHSGYVEPIAHAACVLDKFDDVDTFLSEKFAAQVLHIAKHGTVEEKKSARKTVLELAKRFKNQQLKPVTLGDFFDTQDAEKCFTWSRTIAFGEKVKTVDKTCSKLINMIDCEDLLKLYEVAYIENATRFGNVSIEAEKEKATNDEVEADLYDYVVLEPCASTVCLFVNKPAILPQKELKRCSQNPLHLLDLADSFLNLIEFDVVSVNTWIKMEHEKSPYTNSPVIGVLALSPKYELNNLHVIANMFFGENRLAGNPALWQVAVLGSIALYHKKFKTNAAACDLVRSYCLEICQKKQHFVTLSAVLEPPIKDTLDKCLWYIVNVSSLYEAGHRNILRTMPSSFGPWYEFVFSTTLPPTIQDKCAKYRLWNRMFDLYKQENPQTALEYAASLHFVKDNGIFCECDNDYSKEFLFAVKCCENINAQTARSDKIEEGKPTFEHFLVKKWGRNDTMHHVQLDTETGRHVPVCPITKRPWQECAGGYSVKYASVFKTFPQYVKVHGEYPHCAMDLWVFHNQKVSKGMKIFIYPIDALKAFKVVMEKYATIMKLRSAEQFVKDYFSVKASPLYTCTIC